MGASLAAVICIFCENRMRESQFRKKTICNRSKQPAFCKHHHGIGVAIGSRQER
jgi:hypothetical protein